MPSLRRSPAHCPPPAPVGTRWQVSLIPLLLALVLPASLDARPAATLTPRLPLAPFARAESSSPPSSAAPDSADLDAATQFLLDNTGAYGSWGTLPLRDTTQVLQTLKKRGEDPDPNGLQATWLATAQPIALDLRLRTWIGLALLDETPEEALTLLDAAQNPDGGFTFFAEIAPSSVQETALALQLMHAVEYPDYASVSAAIAYLTGKMQSGGGYGYEDNTPSIAVTAEVVQTLQLWRSVFSLETQISSSIGWMATQQQTDGSFGPGPQSILDTAMVLSVSGGEAGIDPTAWSLGAEVLATAQEPAGTGDCSGAWECDPYTTAWAISALERVKADLLVESLGLQTPGPILESSTVTLQAVVRNKGLASSSSGTVVAFELQDPKTGTFTALGQGVLSGIQPGNTQTVTLSWDTTGVNGARYLKATADSTQKVSESDETNNSLSTAITVTPRVDFAISDADLSYSPENPGLSETITFEARVSNAGGTAATGIVRFILDPESDATVLDEQTVTLAAGESKRITTSSLLELGEHTVQVLLDPDNLLAEGIEDNNDASLTLTMKERIDLVLLSEQIFVSPSTVVEPNPVQVAVTLYNQREDAAENVRVRVAMYDSDTMDSFSDAVPLGTDQVLASVPGNSAQTVYFSVSTAGYPGNNYLVVIVDPDDAIEETFEDNNTGYARVVITAQGNLNTTATDLTFSPSSATENATVRVNLNVRNNGGATLPSAVVKFSASGPSSTVLDLGSVTLPSLATNTYTTAFVDWKTTGQPSGSWTITGTVDPDGLVAEKVETDNVASKAFTLNPRPDLSILTSDITLSPASPEEGDMVTISATVRNVTATTISTSTTFLVRIYDGDPNAGGTLLSETPRAGLNGNTSFVATAPWNTLDLDGAHTLFVQVDPTDTVSELVTSNNQAQKSVTVAKASRPDLQVLSGDMTLTPATGVAPGAMVKVAGIVHNLRDFAASSVGVRLYAGDPATGGVPIGTSTISVPALGSTPVAFDWTTPTSLYVTTALFLVADPDKLIAEPDETNNAGSINYRGRAGAETTPKSLVASLDYHDATLGWSVPTDTTQVTGYRLYRSGTLVNPAADVTAGATATADSNLSTTYPAGNAIDASTTTYWQSSSHAAPWWLELNLTQPRLISRVTLMWHNSYRGSNYQIQGWDGSAWQPMATVTGNTTATVTHDMTAWMTTQRVRIYVTASSSSSYAALYDVKITGADPLSTRTYTDPDLLSDTYEYWVTAVTPSGYESPDSNTAAVVVELPQAVSGLQALPDYTKVQLGWDGTQEPSPFYYLVSRDGILLGEEAKVTGGTATADSTNSTTYTPDKARDGSTSTYWLSTSHAAPWYWELTLTAPQLVSRIDINWQPSYRGTDYDLQAWDGRRWRTLKSIVGNTSNLVSHSLDRPFPTSKLRIYQTKGASTSYSGIYEVDVYAAPQLTTPTLTDAYLLAGPYDYDVTVMNYLGEEGPAESLSSTVPPPIPPSSLTVSAAENSASLSWPAVTNPTATSYLVYRDNALLLPLSEQRTGGTALGDSTYSTTYTADKALDGNTSTYWLPTSHAAPWTWEISWTSARVLTRATLLWQSSYIGQDYQIQGWDGKYWRSLASVTGNSGTSAKHTLLPMATQKLRVYVTKSSSSSYVGLSEINLDGLAPYTGLTYGDTNVPGGPHTYEVSVINTLAEESARRSSTQTVPIPPASGLSATVNGDDVSLAWTASTATNLAGYHLYRGTTLLNASGTTNLATGGTATASSTYSGYSVNALNDGSTSTQWYGLADQTRWTVDISYSTTRVFTGVNLAWVNGYQGSDYQIQARVNGEWVTQATISGNTAVNPAHSFPAVTTDALRLLILRSSNTYPGIYEWRHFSPAPLTTLSSIDRNVPSGTWLYAVRAVDTYGGESAPSQASATVGNLLPPSNLTASATSNQVSLSWDASPSNGVLGYYLYRDDVLVNAQPEVTTPATPSASSVYSTSTSYQVGNAIDGNTSSYWYSAAGTSWTYTLDWSAPRRPSQITVTWHSSYRGVNYDIQRWDGTAWITELEVRNNVDNTAIHKLANFSASTKLRLNILSSSTTTVGIYEIDVYEPTPVTLLAYTDTVRDNGTYHYTARAVSADFLSVPSNVAKVEVTDSTPPAAPSAFKVASYTASNVSLSWTASTETDHFRYKLYYPDSTTLLATVNAATYTHSNVLNATKTSYSWVLTAMDRNGNEGAPSSVTFAPGLPAPPNALTATLQGPNVLLGWTLPTDPLRKYIHVYRDGALLSGTVGPTVTSYLDSLVDNGTRVYELASEDIFGREGAKTAPVSVVVNDTDLSLSSSDLFFLPQAPSEFDDVVLSAVVNNDGDDPTDAVDVDFYDGDPATGGVLIGTAIAPAMQPGELGLAQFTWPLTGEAGDHLIYAFVDPDNTVVEFYENNNIASKALQVDAVPTMEVTFTDVDATAFPKVVASFQVKDNNGQAVPDLTTRNLALTEDLVAQIITKLELTSTTTSTQPKVDLVSVIDTSGSMDAELQELPKIMTDIQTQLVLRGVDAKQVNYSLATNLGGVYTPLYKGIFNGAEITITSEDWAPATAWVAQSYPWRENAVRIIVPVSDENCYQGDGQDANDVKSLNEAIAISNANSATVFGLWGEPTSTSVKQEHTDLSTQTGGQAFSYTEASKIVDAVVLAVLNKVAVYRLEYTTTNTALDGTLRALQLTANYRNATGVGDGSYTAPSSGKADLAAVKLEFIPGNPVAGESATLKGTVANLGSAKASSVVHIYPGSTSADPIFAPIEVADLAPASSFSFTVPWLAVPGTHDLLMVIDPDNTVVESREDNNQTHTELVVPGNPVAELAVYAEELSAFPASPVEGDDVTLSAVVRNLGIATRNVLVQFYRGNPEDGQQVGDDILLSALSPESAETVSVVWNSSSFDGDVTFSVVVDPLDYIAELREDNNRADLTLPIEGRPLTFQVSVDQSSYPAQSPVAIAGRIESRQATAFTGTVALEVRDASENVVATLPEVTLARLPGAIYPDRRYYVPVSIPAFALRRGGQLASASVNFTTALINLGGSGALSPASLRVAEVDANGERVALWPVKALPNPGFNASTAASMTLLWNPTDLTQSTGTRNFRIYFDTTIGGTYTAETTAFVGGELFAVATEQGDVRVSRKAADGTFSTLTSVATFGARVKVAISDLNGDGLQDIVAYDQNKDLYFLAGKSDGTFVARVLLVATDSTATASDLIAADFNQDGLVDVLATEQNSTPRLFMQGTGLKFTASNLTAASSTIYSSDVADINSDGKLDVVVAQNGGLVGYYAGNGNGTFAAIATLCDTPGSTPYGLTVTDVDRDGTLDLLSNQGNSGNSYLCRGNSSGPTFGASSEVTSLKTSSHAAYDDLDYNGDGKRDILLATYTTPKNAQINLGNGDGTFSTVVSLGAIGGDGLNAAVSGGHEQSASVGTPSLNPIPTTTFTASWNTGLTPVGDYHVTAVLLEKGDERNRAQADFTITALEQLLANITTDHPSYDLNELVQLSSSVTNNTLNAVLDGLDARVSIEDPTGTEVFSETLTRDMLLVGEAVSWQTWFNVGANLPGTYSVTLEASAGGATGSATTSFEVNGTDALGLGLVGTLAIDPPQGLPGTVFGSSWQVQNQGNAPLSDLPLQLLLSPADAETELNVYDLGSVTLPIGATESDLYSLLSDALPLGDYRLILQAQLNGEWRSLALSSFRLVNLLGELTALPEVLEGGIDDVALAWTLENGSDSTLPDISVVISLLDNAGLEVATLPQTTEDLPGSASISGEAAYASSLLTLGDYTAVLTILLNDIPLELDRATFSVVDTIAPLSLLTFNGRVVEQEGERYMPSSTTWILSASDSYSGVESIAYHIDGRASQLYAEPITLLEGAHTFAWQAQDRAGNLEPLQNTTAVVDDSPPVITFSGVSSDACLKEGVTPLITITDLSPVTSSQRLNGQPYSGESIVGAGTYTLEVEATDILDHAALASVTFRIETGDCACETGDTVADLDGDGQKACEGDCNDQDPEVNTQASETTDGKDNDCDGLIDEGLCPVDADHDGFATSGGDCDDGDPARNPAAIELGDGKDNNCNGQIDEPGTDLADADADGVDRSAGDCNDTNAATYPGAPELETDGQDNDCDGLVDENRLDCDADGDTFTELQGDCDDGSASTAPGAPDACDAIDQDCDGQAQEDCATPPPSPTEGPDSPTPGGQTDTPIPTYVPTEAPTDGPTDAPTDGPTNGPTDGPTDGPTVSPSDPTPTPGPGDPTPTIGADITASPDPDDVPSGCGCSNVPTAPGGSLALLLLGLGMLWRKRVRGQG